jgi:hypothetical protein
LGEEIVNPYRLGGGALAVFANPLDWLRQGRRGVVVIDAIEAADLLAWAAPIEVHDRALGFRLRKMFAPPRISIANRRQAA